MCEPLVRAGKNNKLNCARPKKIARLGLLFDPPKKFMWVPFSFPGSEAYKLLSGGPKSGVLGRGQIFISTKLMCFFVA